jgi:uncharacterized phage protein (TIGR02216 family)
MMAGLGLMGLAPNVFWSMTLKELDAAVRGRLGATGDAPALDTRELAALMHQFPD